MLPETILIPKSIKEAEDRFVIKVKEQFLTIIKEVNRLEKRIATIKEFTGLEDLLDKIRGKANIDASNVGQNGDIDTTGLWGEALGAGEVREIDNKLVNGSTVYKEVRPPGMLIAYNYIAEKKTTADNLISLDTKLKEVDDEVKSIVMPTFDTSGLATVDLANINYAAESKINGIVRSSIEIKPAKNSNMTITKVLEGHLETYYLKAHGSSIPDIYAHINADNVGLFKNGGTQRYQWSQVPKEGMIEWGRSIGTGNFIVKHTPIDYFELGNEIGDINPATIYGGSSQQSWDYYILPSLSTLLRETRQGYANDEYNIEGLYKEGNNYFSRELSFVDETESVSDAIHSLNESLSLLAKGVASMWAYVYGDYGSPFYLKEGLSHNYTPAYLPPGDLTWTTQYLWDWLNEIDGGQSDKKIPIINSRLWDLEQKVNEIIRSCPDCSNIDPL